MNSAKISARFQEETMNQSISSQIIDHKMRNQAENRNPKSRFVEYLSVIRDREWTPLSLSLSLIHLARALPRAFSARWIRVRLSDHKSSLIGSQIRIRNPIQ